MHGGAPRVRHKHNDTDEGGIVINTEMLANKVADAAISASVAYIISKA